MSALALLLATHICIDRSLRVRFALSYPGSILYFQPFGDFPGRPRFYQFLYNICLSASSFATLLFPLRLDAAAVLAHRLAEKARYPLLPMFRLISRITVLGVRLISIAIARIDLFSANPLLMLFSFFVS